MADLASLQNRMAQGLLAGRYDALVGAIVAGPIGADEALDIHRATSLGGLVKALRLSFPTVEALVGEAFFEQAALAFVTAQPPSSPWLTGYGAGFAEFLRGHGGAQALAYLPDVARFDWAVEAVAADALGEDGLRLDLGDAVLTLDASLRMLAFEHPALDIRDAVEAGDEALAALDPAPRRQAAALWRASEGAGVRSLAPLSAAFLSAILSGGDVEAVVSAGADLTVLQTDVFRAPFARLTLKA
ncbi:MAG TPA: DNA-binding domain-containing protein [Caulobacteraceae bacterium]|nr:DNA-binding domain-containing protein [Caulobacteraceae bacterium]